MAGGDIVKYVLRFNWQGDITVDAKSEDEAVEHVMQTFSDTDLFNTSVDDYDTEPVEVLSCKLVSP